jgi:hypothetical protein
MCRDKTSKNWISLVSAHQYLDRKRIGLAAHSARRRKVVYLALLRFRRSKRPIAMSATVDVHAGRYSIWSHERSSSETPIV